MNPFQNALQHGYGIKEILDYLVKQDKDNGPKIERALTAGYSPEEILNHLSGTYGKSKSAKQEYKPFAARLARKGMTEKEREEIIRKEYGKKGILPKAILGGTALTALAGGASALSGQLGPAASQIRKAFGGLSGPASGMNPPQPPGPGPIPQGGGGFGSTAANLMQMAAPVAGRFNPAAGAALAAGGYLAEKLSQPSAGGPSATTPMQMPDIKGLVTSVASIFGFKNKPLIAAVANLAQETGQTVKQIYDDLSKESDLSTPEKAEAAALKKLQEIGGELTAPISGKTMTERHEKMKTIKPAAEVKKQIAKDLKSSVIRKTTYNGKDKQLKVVFNNGHTYEYDDFPEEEYKKLTAGTVAAKTKGSNEFGSWWVGKRPSAGASFNQLVKAPGYNYRRTEDTEITPEEEEELAAVGAPSATVSRFIQPTEKAEKVAHRGKAFAGRTEMPITHEQVRSRRQTISRNIDQIRSMPSDQRRERVLDNLTTMLHDLEQRDKILQGKKVKLKDKEAIRFEHEQDRKLIKKLLLVLPKAVIAQVKNKVETGDVKDIVKLIQSLMKR